MNSTPIIFDNRKDMIKHYANELERPRILEIGIFKGEFFDYIVDACNPQIMDGVDFFEGIAGSGDADGNNFTYCNIGESYLQLCEKYANIFTINLHKMSSNSFFNIVNNNYYDIIYIDGDHSYEGVKSDLDNAYNKIRPGGYIMGHDYEMNMEKARTHYEFGVKRAVTEFCDKYNQTIVAKAMDGCVSFCIKVNK